MEDKKAFRKEMKKRRTAVTIEESLEAERRSVEILRSLPIYQNTSWFYPYISYQKEMPTLQLIKQLLLDGKHVAVPKVLGEEMEFFEIHSIKDCEPGCMGILEPVDGLPCATERGIVLMPGLAFDEKGGRMGYGGGFYDKYLSKHPDHVTIGWMYDLQLVEEVPMEPHDHRTQYLISPEKGFRACK